MRGKRKRKDEEEVAEGYKQCVLHMSWTPDCDHFTFFSSLKDPGGRLEHLNSVKARRMGPSVLNAEQRMEDICRQIPETLVEGMGYHTLCYKTFTRMLSIVTMEGFISQYSKSSKCLGLSEHTKHTIWLGVTVM